MDRWFVGVALMDGLHVLHHQPERGFVWPAGRVLNFLNPDLQIWHCNDDSCWDTHTHGRQTARRHHAMSRRRPRARFASTLAAARVAVCRVIVAGVRCFRLHT
jgi:hypothetical protein